MDYLEYEFDIPPDQQEILIAILSELPFEGFEQLPLSLKAYLPSDEVSEQEINKFLIAFPFIKTIPFNVVKIGEKNWNAIWEKNFEAVVVKDKLTVRASFHKEPLTDLDIVIDPQMAFGTGHHATTLLMLEWMLSNQFKDKFVLDFGSGSGILAILASKLGCREVVALENDLLAFETLKENILVNNLTNIRSYLVEKRIQLNRKFDIVLMNINRNTIIEKMNVISRMIRLNGLLTLSGFYHSDLIEITTIAEGFGFEPQESATKENWSCVILKKI